ncbi:hypothetical protein HXX01_00210 [Candidatus Nomurabacteria bacterium]|nr:hypothetical protein [Candidatus Nomurabacteria bacterium]
MENKFSETMSIKTNWELLEIVTNLRDEYQIEAVEVAEDELKKRNLGVDQLNELKAQIIKDIEAQKAIYIKSKQIGKPIKSAPKLETTNGIGTAIYSDTLYYVVFYIPILPLSRYSLDYDGNKTYTFYGELELYRWQKIWQYCLIAITVSLALISIIYIIFWIFVLND